MGSKENAPSNANSGNKNRRRFKKKSIPSESPNRNPNNNPELEFCEMKFYMHNSAQRKSSESFGKIKEEIILKIQLTFESLMDSVKLLRDGKRNHSPNRQ